MRLHFLFFSLLFFIYSCKSKVEKTNPVKEKITESVYASGIIKTKNQYQVYPTATGIIEKILVTENDLVGIGTPLMIVSDKTTNVNVQNAALAANYADVNANREKLVDVKNAIALAQAKLSSDSLVFRRQQNLWTQGIGSRIELEQRELAYKNSITALQSAKIKYTELQKQLSFTAQQSRNNLSISKYRASDLVIKSELKGRVYSIFKERGEMVNPQMPVAIIGDPEGFLLELQIDEYDIVKIKPGQQVLISMDSYKGQVFEARVSRINPIMNDRTKSFLVEADFTKQPPTLYPNLTVEANIVINTKDNAITIPRSYLVNDSLVLVEKDKRRQVIVGLKDYQKVEIIKGLNISDVIYKPQQ